MADHRPDTIGATAREQPTTVVDDELERLCDEAEQRDEALLETQRNERLIARHDSYLAAEQQRQRALSAASWHHVRPHVTARSREHRARPARRSRVSASADDGSEPPAAPARGARRRADVLGRVGALVELEAVRHA